MLKVPAGENIDEVKVEALKVPSIKALMRLKLLKVSHWKILIRVKVLKLFGKKIIMFEVKM